MRLSAVEKPVAFWERRRTSLTCSLWIGRLGTTIHLAVALSSNAYRGQKRHGVLIRFVKSAVCRRYGNHNESQRMLSTGFAVSDFSTAGTRIVATTSANA